jgi:hypothetical protein
MTDSNIETPTQPLYQDRIIAFVDILGFKSIIKQSEHNHEKVKAIIKSLEFLKSSEKTNKWNLALIEIEEDAQKRGLEKFDISSSICCTCFSDTIVVSAEVSDNNIDYVTSTLVANLAYLCVTLLDEGVLVRGAITTGKLIHSSNGLLLGPALIQAYELEVNTAKFPRIIFSNRLLNRLNYPLVTKKDRFPYHQYLQRYDDGCVGFHSMIFLQVMQNWVGMGESNLKNYLIRIKNVILTGLDSSFEHPDVFTKYEWLRLQYNSLIIIPEKLKINIPSSPSNLNIHFTSF